MSVINMSLTIGGGGMKFASGTTNVTGTTLSIGGLQFRPYCVVMTWTHSSWGNIRWAAILDETGTIISSDFRCADSANLFVNNPSYKEIIPTITDNGVSFYSSYGRITGNVKWTVAGV